MPLFSRTEPHRRRSVLGRTVGTGVRAVRLLGRGTARGGRLAGRGLGRLRTAGAGGEIGLARLFDLHAASCAGDTLIAIGLAGTIFFNVPLGEARSKVAMYLLVTMVPFALLAPVVGPLLDHFRHGRRYALAATMLGRALLAWLIADHLTGFALYPAAFGVLALSRAYGVARSAAVPRLLPEGLGLSQAGARASVYGTVAGALLAPVGLAAFWFGPQWPLRVSSLVFLAGTVVATQLPARADSDPPETVPRPFAALRARRRTRPLAGRLTVATLTGGAVLRGGYGFLLLFLAFAVRAGDLTTALPGRNLGAQQALGLIGGALAGGTFLATALGTRVRIRRPVRAQALGLGLTAASASLATVRFSLPTVALCCLVTAVASGMAKLAVDATIAERVPERTRASAFAHSETALMLAFVAGGALGLVPFDGRLGVGVLAGITLLCAVGALVLARRLRTERLDGRAAVDGPVPVPAGATTASTTTAPPTAGPAPVPDVPTPVPDVPAGSDDGSLAPPGFHIYRPSSARRSAGDGGTDGGGRGSRA
jgi:MFS family permease